MRITLLVRFLRGSIPGAKLSQLTPTSNSRYGADDRVRPKRLGFEWRDLRTFRLPIQRIHYPARRNGEQWKRTERPIN